MSGLLGVVYSRAVVGVFVVVGEVFSGDEIDKCGHCEGSWATLCFADWIEQGCAFAGCDEMHGGVSDSVVVVLSVGVVGAHALNHQVAHAVALQE